MIRACPFINAIALCAIILFHSVVYARGYETDSGNPCSDPELRTDVRPNSGGPPVKISVGIRMLDLAAVSDINQTLTGDFAVVQSWTDLRLTHLEGCEISINGIWTPELQFGNSGRKFTSKSEVASIGPGGIVKYVQRYSGDFATYHNLEFFPFDKQIFRIFLLSFELSEQEIQIVVDEKITGRRPSLNISNWMVDKVEGTIGREYLDSLDYHTPRYDFKIFAQRNTAYYLWKVILPLCLIVAMSWCVFWINPEQYGPQIGLSATSMLTLIAFIFATTNMVPELGYLTLLDKFIVGSTMLVFLALVESLTTVYLVSIEKKTIAGRMDRISRWLFPIAFAAIVSNVFFA
jgi:hypothetical protein